MLHKTSAGTRATIKRVNGHVVFDVRGSLFCQVRAAEDLPLCGFYASAIAGFLRLFDLDADAKVSRCSAVGPDECQMSVVVRKGDAMAMTWDPDRGSFDSADVKSPPPLPKGSGSWLLARSLPCEDVFSFLWIPYSSIPSRQFKIARSRF